MRTSVTFALTHIIVTMKCKGSQGRDFGTNFKTIPNAQTWGSGTQFIFLLKPAAENHTKGVLEMVVVFLF